MDAEFQEDLAELLTTEAFQSAVMELVSSGGVRLGEGWVRITRGRVDGDLQAFEVATPAILLAVQLEQRGRQRA